MAEKSFWSEKKDKEWVSNFFFYYKKHVIVFLFIAFVVIYSCVSCMNKVDYDLEMYYISDTPVEARAFEDVKEKFKGVIEDADGKDGKNVFFNNFTVSSDNAADIQMSVTMNTKIDIELAEGNGYLYFVDEKWAKFCTDREVMEDISQYTGDEEPCYFVDVSNNKMLNELGLKHDGKIYAGVRVLNDNRADDKIYIKKHDNAIKALKYILEMK